MPSNDGDGGEAAASTGGKGGKGREAVQHRLHPRDQVWQRLDLSLLSLPQQPAPRERLPGQNWRRGYLPTRAVASALVPLLAVEVASGSATDPLHFPDWIKQVFLLSSDRFVVLEEHPVCRPCSSSQAPRPPSSLRIAVAIMEGRPVC
jgi:hypothetical protein